MPAAERRSGAHPAGRLHALLLAAALIHSAGAQQDDPEAVRAELEELQQRIGAISDRLATGREARDREQAELAAAEKAVGELELALRRTRERLDDVRGGLEDLDRQAAALEREIASRREALAAQLRIAYRTGLRSRLKALLNQEDPGRISRVLALHGYLGRARQRAIEALSARLAELERIRAERELLATELEGLVRRRADERAGLERAVARREEALAGIESRLLDQSQRLDQLRASAQRLRQLLEDLDDALADIPPDAEIRPFSELRGRLPMPVDASVQAGFADRRSGNVRWEGWLMASRIGEPVQAVAYGRVAYADWLRGYGMLLIIDHGDDFMTLYGQNRSLVAEVGDWVEPGEVIALAGDSGGFGRPGLYFQIRHQGRPVDPAGWMDR